MSWPEVIGLIVLGLAAGAIGGLMGIGGSVLMIPVLTLVFHRDQHLSQAAAMIVNFFVAAAGLVRHQRAGAVPWIIVRRVLPASLAAIVLGVAASNHLDGSRLEKVFGVFLIYVIFINVVKLLGRTDGADERPPRQGWGVTGVVGGATGFAAGLLGIGGGIISVALLQRLCHLSLRRCIAASAATMCVTATVGAVYKNLTLPALVGSDGVPLGLSGTESVVIAACLTPTAIIGGLFGAGLTHTMPLVWLRVALLILLTIASAKFLGVL